MEGGFGILGFLKRRCGSVIDMNPRAAGGSGWDGSFAPTCRPASPPDLSSPFFVVWLEFLKLKTAGSGDKSGRKPLGWQRNPYKRVGGIP